MGKVDEIIEKLIEQNIINQNTIKIVRKIFVDFSDQEFEVGYNQGFKEGYEEGTEDGLKEGYNKGYDQGMGDN